MGSTFQVFGPLEPLVPVNTGCTGEWRDLLLLPSVTEEQVRFFKDEQIWNHNIIQCSFKAVGSWQPHSPHQNLVTICILGVFTKLHSFLLTDKRGDLGRMNFSGSFSDTLRSTKQPLLVVILGNAGCRKRVRCVLHKYWLFISFRHFLVPAPPAPATRAAAAAHPDLAGACSVKMGHGGEKASYLRTF